MSRVRRFFPALNKFLVQQKLHHLALSQFRGFTRLDSSADEKLYLLMLLFSPMNKNLFLIDAQILEPDQIAVYRRIDR